MKTQRKEIKIKVSLTKVFCECFVSKDVTRVTGGLFEFTIKKKLKFLSETNVLSVKELVFHSILVDS